jgi:signal transduction histidine kinase
VNRLLPRTLVGQMILILLGGLVISHLVVGWIYSADRQQAVRAISGYAATQRIANLARLIDEAPEEWRGRIVAAANDTTLRVTLSAQPPANSEGEADTQVQSDLAEQLPEALAARLRVVAAGAQSMPFGGFARPGMMMGGGMMGQPMHRPTLWRSLAASFQLTDGQYLSFTAILPASAPATSWQFLVALIAMSVVVVLSSIWAVRRVTAPLGTVIRAAERLGRDVNAPPIVEAGSREMRQAAHAFNDMQARLQRLLENRTRMLAALSHDLRTPLTLLRLRVEGQAEGDERERMLGNIGELDAMIDATLQFARDEAKSEPWRRTDVTALLAAIVDDMADAGLNVSMEPAVSEVLECQPGGLRRVLGNLLDNALKYGHSAHAALHATLSGIEITIDDGGPGIPDAELQRVFEPFYRLEQSRNRDTGGTGLGLAIAQSIAQAHGGQITLANRPEGGLRATLTLPR